MTFSALPGQADALTCNMPGVPTDASNLVIKVSHQRLLYSSLEPIRTWFCLLELIGMARVC